MWTHVSLNCEIVWDDALYRVLAIWQESAEVEPVVLERSGRVPLGGDATPRGALKAAVAALSRAADAGWEEEPGI